MTYPAPDLYPGPTTFPGGPVAADTSGNPTGFDESAFWTTVDPRPEVLRWLAVDLVNGRVICELPGISSADATRRTIGRYESLSAKLNVTATTSPDWLTATRPMQSALIAFRGPAGGEVIAWGGVVLRRQRSVGTNQVSLTIATPECYLDSRYTGAYTTDPSLTGVKRDQNTVVADLVAQFCVANQGLPITVQTVGGAGQQVLAAYNDYDDKTVYSNLGSLSGVLNGPEWTGHWVWNSGANTITPILYVGNRIGTPASAGFGPAVTFDATDLIEATLDENYTSGSGANDVTATSTGEGLARPQATAVSSSFNGRPRVQFRYQPTTSIQDPLTLQQHATQSLALLAEGTNTVTLKASATTGPQLGVDWGLGDDIGYFLDGPAFPGGFSGVGRCIGYEADDTYTSPVLYVPAVS